MQRSVKRSCCLLMIGCSLFATSLAAKTVYKIVHADGSVTYTDTPQPGAVKVPLSAVNVAETSTKPTSGAHYKLTITQPADGSTVINSNGYVTVSAEMQPFAEGSFQLMVDGLPIHTQSHPNFALKDVEEGSHQIQVNFIGEDGKIASSSAAQRFTMQRTQ